MIDVNCDNVYQNYLDKIPRMNQIAIVAIQEPINFSYDIGRFIGKVIYSIPCRDGTVYIMMLPEDFRESLN